MAVDTARKRASALSYVSVGTILIPPQSGVPQADQQTINHMYGGVLAALPSVSTLPHNALMLAVGKGMNR